jgi:hypothetical protein
MADSASNETWATKPTDASDGDQKGPQALVPHHDPTCPATYASATNLFAFADPESIKANVRASREVPHSYDVKDFYKDDHESIFSKIAQNPLFEKVTISVICINACWIAVDTDWNAAMTFVDRSPQVQAQAIPKEIFITADVLFFMYFSLELFIRFVAFERKLNSMKDGWFVFDSTLVALYALDPFVLTIVAAASGGADLPFPTSILRLFRLARLTRLVRMLRSFPELVIMVKGMLTAVASVMYCLGLLIMITYVFSIALTQISDREYEGGVWETYYTSVPHAMYTLAVYGLFGDNLAEFCDMNRAENTACLIIVTIYVILASMTVLNMLIGILCQVISSVAIAERESIMVDQVHSEFESILKTLDKDNNGTVGWQEFQVILTSQVALKALEGVGVDPEGFIDAAEDSFFEDGAEKEVTFDALMRMILDCRGGQNAMVSDVIKLGNRFSKKMLDVKGMVDTIDEKLEKLKRKYKGED